jgi:hypothetical protein
MSEILSWAFVIVAGGFFFGMMVYMFYLGLRPNKKNPAADLKK